MLEYFPSVNRTLGLILTTTKSRSEKDLKNELRSTNSSLERDSESHCVASFIVVTIQNLL